MEKETQEIEELKKQVEQLRKNNKTLRAKLAAYQRSANRQYRNNQDYLPYDDDERRE